MMGQRIHMADLMSDLSPWILAGFFGLVTWYMRQAAAQHESLTASIGNLVKEMRQLEKQLDEQVNIVSRRFERYAMSTSERLAAIETRCTVEHGSPPHIQPIKRHWSEDSDVSAGTR